MKLKRIYSILLAIFLPFIFSCAPVAIRQGRHFLKIGEYDKSAQVLAEVAEKHPNDPSIKSIYTRAKLSAAQQHFERAKEKLAREDYEGSFMDLQISLSYDPSNQYARDTLSKVTKIIQEKEKQKKEESSLTIDEMKAKAAQKTGVPELDPSSNVPIVMKFTQTTVKRIFEALSKASGINFIYDANAEVDKKIDLDLANVNFQSVLDFIMMQIKHFYKVIDEHTIVIIPDNKAKRLEYEDQVVKTFYLSNGDAKEVFQLLRGLFQTRKMATDKNMNSITIKDTPEMVAVCQKIIEQNDKSKGEVIVDVELVEINKSKTKEFGIDLTGKEWTLAPPINTTTDEGGVTTFSEKGANVPINQLGQALGNFSDWVIGPLPNIAVQFLLTDTDTKVLAHPQVRVAEGEKAEVHIGDRVPVPTTQFQSYGTGSGGTITPITSFTYQDVGVKINIEPRVHHNKEITLKLKVEVSSITGYTKVTNQPDQPLIGTRKIDTTIRLGDGETNILAGLIKEEDSNSMSGVPILSEIPLLKHLFSSTTKTKRNTDIVLLLTPHIVRVPNITDEDLEPLWVGTEDNVKLKGFKGSSFVTSPFEEKSEESEGETETETETETKTEQQSTEKEEVQNPPRMMISPAYFQSVAGSTNLINLILLNGKDIASIQFTIDYPTDLVELSSLAEGDFLRSGGSSTQANRQDPKPGLVVFSISRTSPQGATGNGAFASLTFKCLKEGQARIQFTNAVVTTITGESLTMPAGFCTINITKPQGK